MAGCQPYTQEEIDLILEKMKDDLQTRVIFKLGNSAGPRISELLTLRVDDVLNPDGTLKKSVKIARRNTKGQTRSHICKVTPFVADDLLRLAISTQVQGKEYLFGSRQGDDVPMHRSTAWRRLEKYSRLAKVWDTGCHRMRKTFAKRVYESTGKNIYEAQKALGHVDIKSTTFYLEDDREYIDGVIDDLF